jgi:cytochrome P450
MTNRFAPDDPDFWIEDPHPELRRLRHEDPVHWYAPGRFWCLTKHADVELVSRSPGTFTSTRGIQIGMDVANRPYGIPPSILEMDPPEHNRHRKLVIQAFTPRAIGALEPRVREIAREALDAVPPGEVVDFVETIAVPLPMYVIAEMLGVPRSDRTDFRRWSDALVAAGGGELSERTRSAMSEILGYFAKHLAARRQAPDEDLVSLLAAAEIDGDRLSDPEILMFCLTLLVAGNETTRNLISGGAWLLMQHPDQRRTLVREPARIANAVEEMLRWWTPVWSFARRATCETKLRDEVLREGAPVLLLYAAANRDEEVWGEDSEDFDIRRDHSHRRHLAFGFGEHLCLGASLARLEARVLFEELLARLPEFEPAGPIRRLRSRLMHGVEHLPVVFGRRVVP